MAKGEALDLEDKEIEEMLGDVDDDLDDARDWWRANAPGEYQSLLDAPTKDD